MVTTTTSRRLGEDAPVEDQPADAERDLDPQSSRPVAAAVEPHHHRQRMRRGRVRRPDVQVEAILVLARAGVEPALRTQRSRICVAASCRPRRRRLRRPPAQVADRRCGEGDAEEAARAAVDLALQHAVGDIDERALLDRGRGIRGLVRARRVTEDARCQQGREGQGRCADSHRRPVRPSCPRRQRSPPAQLPPCRARPGRGRGIASAAVLEPESQVAAGLARRHADDIMVLLAAMGIPASSDRDPDGTWRVEAPPPEVERARALVAEEYPHGFPAEDDAPAPPVPQGPPPRLWLNRDSWAVALAVLACVAWFVHMQRSGPLTRARLIALGAITWDQVWVGEWWRLLSAVFVHFDGAHLLTNMLTLLLVGPPLAYLLGPWRFLVIFLLTGIAGNVASQVLAPSARVEGRRFGGDRGRAGRARRHLARSRLGWTPRALAGAGRAGRGVRAADRSGAAERPHRAPGRSDLRNRPGPRPDAGAARRRSPRLAGARHEKAGMTRSTKSRSAVEVERGAQREDHPVRPGALVRADALDHLLRGSDQHPGPQVG